MHLFNHHVVTRELTSIKDEALNYPENIQPRFIAAQEDHFFKTEAQILASTSAAAQIR